MIHAENALSARSKIRGVAYALTVERMAADMYRHGEGMTHDDLMALGYTTEVVALCAPKARAKAAQRANLN